MDWTAAIERNREALKRVLAMLVAMAGLGNGQSAIGSRQSGASQPDGISDCLLPTAYCLTLPRHLHRAVLRLLRPAEAAARRLVIVMARGLAATPRARKGEDATPPPMPAGAHALPGTLPSSAPRRHTLPLFDPPRRPFRPRRAAAAGIPRICLPGHSDPFPLAPRPAPFDPIDARRLSLRLAALGRALDDLPAQARRFARWQASRAQSRELRKSRRGRRVWPLRAGRPPGQRPANSRRPVHEVHEILHDLHGLAFDVLESPDTS